LVLDHSVQSLSIDFPAQREAKFHFVASGDCWRRSPTQEWLPLAAGDVVLLPDGTRHALADAVRRRTTVMDEFPLKEIGERTDHLSAGGAGARTVLVCCSVSFEEPTVHPFLELMPPMCPLLTPQAEASSVRTPRPGLQIRARW
jgi:hypothetical protein